MSSTSIAFSHTWWKEAVVYQIYPRSFKDSKGSGTGDLAGILQKIDYIASLGVDAVWLNPVYPSPNDDGGYDISDYTGIQPEFGNMADFDALLCALHQRGIKLIMDLVLNHSSDEHPWFSASRMSRENPYREYYFWRPGINGGPPNNWTSFFGGSAWAYDPTTGEYYLHLFSKKQPDLNWENESVRREIHDLMKFWLDKGVDGLRLDVISLISKNKMFPDADTGDFNELVRTSYANGPRVQEFISEMRKEVFDPYHVLTIGEGPGITPEKAMDYLDPGKGLSLIFHFGHMLMDQGPGGRFDPMPWKLNDFKAIFSQWDKAVGDEGWTSVFLGNHDYPRMVSRWGDDQAFRVQSAKMLITLLLTMRGTPFLFQGDELGMTNLTLHSISESRDIETLGGWRQAEKEGLSEKEFLQIANQSGRDNARSPMQWTNGPHAGFTTGTPWMKVNSNHMEINASDQEEDPGSVLNYFRRMIRLRKSNPILTYGSYEPINTGEHSLFGYTRILNDEKWAVLLNFSDQEVPFPPDFSIDKSLVMGNYDSGPTGKIRPWEAIVFKTGTSPTL